ncbi:MAG: nucleotidyltransferase [Acidobacteriaceae bacterium]|nr:nucleotidyltransferase [Acidobacteriaceae bacterium]
MFQGVLRLLNDKKVQYVISGAFALQQHTGIWRDTKDLDIFLPAAEANRALEYLKADGFTVEVTDSVWLAKARRDDYFVDLITGMSNAVVLVDDSWIQRGSPAEVLGVPTRVLGAEELVASKVFVTRRERFDGADIAHVVYRAGDRMDWRRVMQLVGEHWEVLLWCLVLFHYIYPFATDKVPGWLWTDLTQRFQHEIQNPTPDCRFRGSLIDDKMFAIDVNEWGLADLMKECRTSRGERLILPEDAEAA